MKKHTIRAYLCGVFSAFLIFALMVPSFADSVSKQLTAVYNGVSISINGTKLDPKDASGNAVQPFIVDGTTYLPVRAVADAVGYDVQYDSATNSIALTTKGKSVSPSPSPSATSTSKFNETLRDNLISRMNVCFDVANVEYKDANTTVERKKVIDTDLDNMQTFEAKIIGANTNDQLAQYEKQVEYYESLYK